MKALTVGPRRPDNAEASWHRMAAALLVVLAIVLVAYRDTVAGMASIWLRSETFAHALLVPPIVLWLVWRQRRLLATITPRPCAWVLLPIAAVALLWLLGEMTAANSVTELAMTALLVLAVPAVLGIEVGRALLFPLGFLFFAVPIGEFLLPLLMTWTADFTVLALRASGIPVFREGTHFVIPSGSWSVVEACSGVRYLIASLMIGTLFAYLNYRSWRRRLAFVGVAVAVPVVANWLRAYLIVLLGHVTDNRLAAGADHLIYGWLFFGLVIGLMYTIGIGWREADPKMAAVVAASPSESIMPAQRLWAVVAAVAALALLPRLVLPQFAGGLSDGTPQLSALGALGEWHAGDRSITEWRPAFRTPSAELHTNYFSGTRAVGVYIGYYRAQGRDRKLVSSSNELVASTDPRWAEVGPTSTFTITTPRRQVRVRSTPLRGGARPGGAEQRLTVWQLFWAGDRLTASEQWAAVYSAVGRLLGHGDDGAVIVLYAASEEADAPPAALEAFASANLDSIVARLRTTRMSAPATVAATASQRSGDVE